MSSKFSKSFGNASNAAIRITSYAVTIKSQKDLVINEIPYLPQHQQTARGHADNWQQNIWPEIKAVSQDIVNYAQIYDRAYKELDGLVDRLKKGDEKAKDHFKLLLTDVVLVGYQQANIGRIASSTETFKKSVEVDFANFQADSEAAKEAYTRESNTLKVTQKNEEEAHEEVVELRIEIIAKAAELAITLTALVVVTIFSFGEADEELAEEAEEEAEELVELNEEYALALLKDYQLQLEIKQEQEELAKLNTVRHQLNGFSGSTSNTATAAQAVADGWIELGDELTDLIQKLDKISPEEAADVIHTQLSAANKEWQVVLAQAKLVEPSGTIPVKKYGSMEEFVNKINPKAMK